MGVPDSDLCWHCKQDKSTFDHMVLIQEKDVMDSLGKITGNTVLCDPVTRLLNYTVSLRAEDLD